MAGGQRTIQVEAGCADLGDFRKRRLGSFYRDEFPVSPVASLAKGDLLQVELLANDGAVLIAGTAVVTSERGPFPNDDKMMLAFVEFRQGEQELQQEAWGGNQRPEQDDGLADHPAPAFPPELEVPGAPAPARRSRLWMWLALGGGGLAAVALAVLVATHDSGTKPAAERPATQAPADAGSSPEALRAEKIADLVTRADTRLTEGRIVGPGGDYALDLLLEAKKLAPGDPQVAHRLTAIADRFEKLGESALEADALDEAATHFQIVITADPGRERARARIDEIEARVKGKPTP